MKLIGNIIWIILGGFVVFLEYMFAGIILCLTVIGIPFGIQCFKIAFMILAPFGKEIVDQGGTVSLLMNVLWIIFFGIGIALSHLMMGFLLFITIIGIPFAIQHFKFAILGLLPFGKIIR
ncbi:MAG: hypothetical protein A2Y40_09465 [Candidatus Margulisbacteria bacterium GWF2_35_9]|nr:MAG: hypothetical protein A2Y40_09465 [Candidatus Margulisbacteria bacterium GWF2_35_9]